MDDRAHGSVRRRLLRLYWPFRWFKLPAYLIPLLASGAALFLATGCTTVITPPIDPEDPTSVFILDFGRHAALVLPEGEGWFVRYAYGDWDYFALERDDIWHGFLALAVPTRGALGRQRFSAADPGEMREARFQTATREDLVVSRDDVERLLDRLDQRFEAAIDTRVYSNAYDLDFVEDPRSYIWYRNCNTVLVDWLTELECECRGTGWFASFDVQADSR